MPDPKRRLVRPGASPEYREKILRSWCRTFGYSLKRGLDLSALGDVEPGYMLFDNRTGLNVLGGAGGKDGLGAAGRMESFVSSLDDIEDFLGEIHEQVEKGPRWGSQPPERVRSVPTRPAPKAALRSSGIVS